MKQLSIKKTFKESLKTKLQNEFLSRKFLGFILGSVFFALGMLSENGYILIFGMYLGFNVASSAVKKTPSE